MTNKILLAGILVLSACTPAHEDLTEWMDNTRKQAKAKVIPFEAPAVSQPKSYNPPQFDGLNAFESKRLNSVQQGANAPDTNRPKEILEGFSLENLKYVGSLTKGGLTTGYVEADGHVYTVRPGNYIGQNYGKIQSITADQITLTELVEDTYGNWAYRKAELPLTGADANNDTAQNNK
ncbi:pilus assembly protein PilP [Neisseria montereyensis]|uniref:Pilus assembly protein PilP n=1 Tax=Neisseria montereyensis TaxID=2973938 RepID=A0ABT2FEP6_9NEIS|nr:pilus assembly protein PilP [Neisseria montereyensis]MCS4534209.1 pilus assembly protein PilP [Neisseria montereyensis]